MTSGLGTVLNDRRLVPLGVGLVLLPLVVSAVALVVGDGADWRPVADHALIELRTGDVGRHPVLTGLYSREGWNHPGPLLFYLLAVTYRLTGSASIGLALGALAINGAALAGMALVARRLGGPPLALLTLLGSALLVTGLGADFVRDPWTPFATVLPFALLVLLTWAMVCGRTWALPVAAPVATFCVQTHLAYTPLVAPLFAGGALWLIGGALRRPTAPAGEGAEDRVTRPGRPAVACAAAVAALVLAVLWAPAVVDQVTTERGNAGAISRYFLEGEGDRELHSLGDGWRVVTGQFGLPPEWVSGARSADPISGEHRFLQSAPPPVLLLAMVAAAFVLVRRRSGIGARLGRRLVAVVALALGLGVVTVSRVPGLVYIYLVRWTWALAMVAAVAVAWVAWQEVTRRSPRIEARWLRPTALAGLALLAGVNAVGAARVGTPQEPYSSTLGALIPDVVDALPEGDGEVLVRAGSFSEHFYSVGILLGLERQGVDARTDQFEGRVVGEHRVFTDGPVRAALRVATGEAVDTLAKMPGQRLVASWDRFSEKELARRRGRISSLDAEHDQGAIGDADWVLERSRLLPFDARVAIFSSERVPG